jgi:hypothetical protein
MKLDLGMHIVMHLVFFGKAGVTEKCKRVYLPPCNRCLVGRSGSNLVVESRDDILFKGGRL